MSLAIQSFYLGNTRDSVINNLPTVATLLGLNYDTENSVMYKGSDNTSGFYFITNNSTYFYIGFKYQGVETSTNVRYNVGYYSNGIYLYYYKQEDETVVFGFSSSINLDIYAACAKVTKLEDEIINDWAYIMNYPMDDSLIMCPSLWSNFIYGETKDYNRSFNVVTLIPYIFEVPNIGNFKFEKLFKVFTKDNFYTTQSLILNNKKYIISSTNINGSIMPFTILVE